MTRERIVGIVLALVTVVVVTVNQTDVGVARDEVVYMQHGSRYADWWVGLVTGDHGMGRESITKSFGGKEATANNREHPPLMKTLFGLSEKLLHDKLGIAGEVTAYRFPTALMHGLCVLLVYAMALALWGFAEAVVAALLLMALPRALFHAGLACFDAPIMTLWFATVVAYWRCLDGRKWPWTAGVVFGLALATKHNALLLPFGIAGHYAFVAYRADRWRGLLLHRWRVVVSFLVLAPLTLAIVWPWLWFDPIAHLDDWITFHRKHVHYNFEYLGGNWNAPPFPWHVPVVTTAFTVPVVTLAAGVLGVGVWWRRRAEVTTRSTAPGALLLLTSAASFVPFLLGSTPIFGAEKHWMPVLPPLCIVAAVGVTGAARGGLAVLERYRPVTERIRIATLVVIASLVIGAATVETVTAQPYALTWYNALAGGAPGGADLGMNRQFWGISARGVLPVLRGRPAVPIYTHDARPAWGIYQRDGLVARDMRDSGHEQQGIAASKLALVIHERHFNRHDYLIWKAYGTVKPWFVLRADGVPIVTIYARP